MDNPVIREFLCLDCYAVQTTGEPYPRDKSGRHAGTPSMKPTQPDLVFAA